MATDCRIGVHQSGHHRRDVGRATADDLADAGPTAVGSSVAELAAQMLSDAR